ncbi:hypothetical protein C3B51_02535 [Pseudoalteromonas rubra]|uniref:Uncharacterized protein n=1 Tax=Pseudoalteromonas rubra TaxID=43658 RepID=A0A4Q7ERI3_9GAMM|nr:hypothetical protein C3B51_02535 [Pseudoalteromonas rubra]
MLSEVIGAIMSYVGKLIVFILAILAFAAQGMSAMVMNCEVHMQGHTMHGTAMHKAPSNHHHGDELDSELLLVHPDSAQDCCESDCACPANACSSAQLLPVAEFSLTTDPVFLAAIWHDDQLPIAVAQSLYRPPIFA